MFYCVRVRGAVPPTVTYMVHVFAGFRREGDLEWWLVKLAAEMGVRIFVASIDLPHGWNLEDPATVAILVECISLGLVDFLIGGPPCATWSVRRFIRPGPRPLRFRGKWAWGRPDLSPREWAKVKTANALMFTFLTLAELVAKTGGGVLLEHPADPMEEPKPSIFATEELEQWLLRIRGEILVLDQ